jgi:hypothetical protein
MQMYSNGKNAKEKLSSFKTSGHLTLATVGSEVGSLCG